MQHDQRKSIMQRHLLEPVSCLSTYLICKVKSFVRTCKQFHLHNK